MVDPRRRHLPRPFQPLLSRLPCQVRTVRPRTMQSRLTENLAASQADDFVARMTAELQRRGVHVLRIQFAADFFDADYARKWASIARRCPWTTFYAYTRSWRIPTIVPALEQLARLPNLRLWYSGDLETGQPPGPSHLAGVRTALVHTDRNDQPTGDLILRGRPLRGLSSRRPSLYVVSPTEAAVPRRPELTCTSCRLCHR